MSKNSWGYETSRPPESLTARDIRDFNEYLANCSDWQVRGVFEKEYDAGRHAYAELARAEAVRRGVPWL